MWPLVELWGCRPARLRLTHGWQSWRWWGRPCRPQHTPAEICTFCLEPPWTWTAEDLVLLTRVTAGTDTHKLYCWGVHVTGGENINIVCWQMPPQLSVFTYPQSAFFAWCEKLSLYSNKSTSKIVRVLSNETPRRWVIDRPVTWRHIPEEIIPCVKL
jgi:hypothetical protein